MRVHFVESTEPSVLAHEILNGKPYTFLDDAPLEERRTRAVQLRRGLPLHAEALGRLDPAALERVRAEAAPDVRGPEELHDLLLSTVVLAPAGRLPPPGSPPWPTPGGPRRSSTVGAGTPTVSTAGDDVGAVVRDRAPAVGGGCRSPTAVFDPDRRPPTARRAPRPPTPTWWPPRPCAAISR